MKFIDMHCDTLTSCSDKGLDLARCGLQTSLEKLRKVGYICQCFAIFTEGENANTDFYRYLFYYKKMLSGHGDIAAPVLSFKDISRCEKEGKLGCILTVENLSFTGGDLSLFPRLKDAGVKMASLVWNSENIYARPNLVYTGGREARGLTPLGKEAAEMLDKLKIIIDISHLSDGGADELLTDRKIPLVASHSNAASVCGVPRNLTDAQIKKIADCGGVVGVNFYSRFLGGAAFESVLRHIKHIINVGGEGVVALGGDFDGIPPTEGLEDCGKVPALFEYLEQNSLSPRVIENFAYKNFLRVFAEFG